MSSPTSAAERYESRLQSIDADLNRHEATDRKFASIRMVCFVGLVLGIGFATTTQHLIWGVLGAASLIAFLVAVVLNERVRDEMSMLRNQSRSLHRLVARTKRDWKTLNADSIGKVASNLSLSGRQQALASDLDLVGEASLFQLVSLAATTPGQTTLTNWLCDPADPAVAMSRHQAVEQLAPQFEERLRFYTLARDVGTSTGDPASFVQWAGEPNWLESRRWLIGWANLTAMGSLGLLAALIFGVLTQDGDWVRISGIALVAIAFVNLSLASVMLGPVAHIFSIAMASRRSVDDYAELFDAANWLHDEHEPSATTEGSTMTPGEDVIAHIRQTLLGDSASSAQAPEPDGELAKTAQRSAKRGMHDLASIARAGGLKQAAATFLIYLPLQAFGLWDVRVLRRLEDWKDHYGDQVASWFAALGELEAIASIAALRDEYPDWASPQWTHASDHDGGKTKPILQTPIIETQSLGHPLLPDHVRVTNDVTIGPTGTLLLVTGSNMSGKSTMLRSLGLNVSLAMAGGPVCCDSMSLPALELATSIRVSDDLSEGVSFYMAELNRLAAVVEHARELGGSASGRVLVYLLDEILQGTNSRERQIAVTRVLRFLVEADAIGAITTHDLELADEPELLRIAETVHFRETIEPSADGDERMTFDYRMREGVSPTTNALRLLEMVGLGEKS